MSKVNYELEEVTLIESMIYRYCNNETALNVSDGEIKTKKHYGGICKLSEQNISKLDSLKLPFENNSFNLVICISVIDVIMYNSVIQFIAELIRVSCGYVLIVAAKDYRPIFNMLGVKVLADMQTYEGRRNIWVLGK